MSVKGSRRSGRLKYLVAFLGELKDAGVDLYLDRQGVDTSTPAGKALFQMLGIRGVRAQHHSREDCGGHRRGAPRAPGAASRLAPLPPAESQSLAGLCRRGSRTPAFRVGVPGAFPRDAVRKEVDPRAVERRPSYAAPRGRIPLHQRDGMGAGGEEMAPSSLQVTDGVP